MEIVAYEIAYCFSRHYRWGDHLGGVGGLSIRIAVADAGRYGDGYRRYADAGADCYRYLGPADADAIPYSDADGNGNADADANANSDADSIAHADAGRPVANRGAGYQGAGLG